MNNIGKFTSNGRELEESVTAMMGISTWAAISGAKIAEAGRAMYNLSQALGTGSVQVRDWMSIENANMATYEFKQMAIETAEALGTLKKKSDGVWESLAGHEVTIENFRENLKDDWFTSDVLLNTLQNYGNFTEALREATEATDTTATEFLRAMEKYEKGEVVDSELIPWIEQLSIAEYDLGRRAFQAAQEAKTFSEAIDATKDAVSTGWMNTFEIIFGDYKTAKGFWTDIANDLWDIFASGGESRNDFLKAAFGSATRAVGEAIEEQVNYGELFRTGLTNILDTVVKIKETASGAFEEVFGTATERGEALQPLIKRFHEMTELVKNNQNAFDGLGKVFETVFRIVRVGTRVLGIALRTGGRLAGIAYRLIDRFLGVINRVSGKGIFDFIDEIIDRISFFADAVTDFISNVVESPSVDTFFKVMGDTFSKVSEKLGDAKSLAKGLFDALEPGVSLVIMAVESLISAGFTTALNLIMAVANVIGGAASSIQTFLTSSEGIQSVWNNIYSKFTKIKETLKGGIDYVRKGFKENGFAGAVDSLYKWITAISKVQLPRIYNYVKNIKTYIEDFGKSFNENFSFYNIVDFFKSIPNLISSGLTGIGGLFTVVFGGILTLITNVINGLNGMNFDIDRIKNTFEKFYDIVQFVFNGIFGDPKEIRERVSVFVSEIWSGFTESLQKVSLRDVVKALRLSIIFVITAKLLSVLKSVKSIADEAATIPESLSWSIKRIGKLFDSIGQSFQANAIIKMAVAVGMVAVALYGLSKIDPDKLTHAAAVISVVMIILTMLVNSIRKAITLKNIDIKKFQVFGTVGSALIGLGVVVASFASAIYKIASIEDPDKLKMAAGVVAGILLAVIGTVWVLSRLFGKTESDRTSAIGSTMLKIGGSIMLISLAIGSLTLPIIALMGATAFLVGKGINIDDLTRSLNSFISIIGLIFLFIGGILAIIGFSKMNMERINALGSAMLKIGASIALIALSIQMIMLPILTLVAVIAALENIKFGKEGKTLGLETLYKALNVMRDIVGAILMIALILSAISLIPFNPVRLLAIAAAITALGVAFLFLAPAIFGVSLVIGILVYLTSTLVDFDKVMKRISHISWELIKIAFAATIFGVGLLAAGAGALAASISIGVLALSFLAIAKGIDILATNKDKIIDLFRTIKNYFNTANILAVAKMAIVLSGFILLLLALTKRLKEFAIAWKVLSKGGSIGEKLSSSLGKFGKNIPNLLHGAFTKVTGYLIAHADDIVPALGVIITIIGGYLTGLIPTIAEQLVIATVSLLSSFAASITAHRAEISQAISDVVNTILAIAGDVFKDVIVSHPHPRHWQFLRGKYLPRTHK